MVRTSGPVNSLHVHQFASYSCECRERYTSLHYTSWYSRSGRALPAAVRRRFAFVSVWVVFLWEIVVAGLAFGLYGAISAFTLGSAVVLSVARPALLPNLEAGFLKFLY